MEAETRSVGWLFVKVNGVAAVAAPQRQALEESTVKGPGDRRSREHGGAKIRQR